MTSKEILELVRAGYTKDEINTMLPSEPPEPPEPPEPANDELTGLKQELESLRKLIQKQNIDNSGRDSPPQQTASEALASLIKKEG